MSKIILLLCILVLSGCSNSKKEINCSNYQTELSNGAVLIDVRTEKEYNSIPLRTNSSRFPFLVILAHIHYNTDWFPDFLDLGFLKSLDLKTTNNQ